MKARDFNFNIWRGIWPFLKPYRGQSLLALLSLIIAAGVILAGGHQLRFMIDQGFGGTDPEALHRSIYYLWIGSAILAAGSAARYYLVTWLGERIIADIRRKLLVHLISLDAAYYETAPTGAAISALTADTAIIQSIVGSSLSVLLRNMILMIGSIALLFTTSTKLTIMILMLVPVIVLPILFFGRHVRRLSRQTQDNLADVSAGLGEVLSGIRTVQAFTREGEEAILFSQKNESVFSTAIKRVQARAFLTLTVIMLIMSGISAILWVGSLDVASGHLSGGQLAAFVFYAIVTAASFGAIGEHLSEIQRAGGALDRILAILAMRPTVMSPVVPLPLSLPAKGTVRFNNVSFSYPSRPQQKALQDIDFSIGAGERVAIVGPSGAGKTTLFQLLLRFYDPKEGHIELDGIDLRRLFLSDLRGTISLVAQEPVIFSSSIADNIRYGRPEASEQEVKEAARLAHAAEFIERLPEGYATLLGEKGVLLSGGQRQRIAIARAVIRNPSLLLLDEATSALDSESELAVQQALEEVMAHRTTMVIAHRLSTVLKADRIIVLNEGRIEAMGSHEQLKAQGGLYTRLADLQFGDI